MMLCRDESVQDHGSSTITCCSRPSESRRTQRTQSGGGTNNTTTKAQRQAKSDKSLREFITRTNIDLFIIACVFGWYHVGSSGMAYAQSEEGGGEGETTEGEEEKEIESSLAVLFPWFIEMMGVFVYYFLSRYVPALPYTACMFIVGFFIGFSVQRVNGNAITESTTLWLGIEGEVILLVFLPGLVYLDSYNIDVHMFHQAFWQIVLFAFPMVLAGMALTALVAYYIFPYGWSFDFSMTFGSILSATDPVAVAVLLSELGAPSRLQMHISGESLMNDGSAVVFYNIFSARFLYELGINGVGEEIGWGKGFAMFFRLAFGAVAIGLAFGIGVVFVLYHLDRRLSGDDNVLQIVLTISAAYLAFFTSEILSGCSGVIATLSCGVTIKAFGETLINDSELKVHFWEITEHLLNSLLFALAGTVWGDLISNNRHTEEFKGSFEGKDWGYLIVLYIFLMAIRFVLIFGFYPITKRIGIGTNWKESLFSSWAGLRGAVGIALALSINSDVVHLTSSDSVDDATRVEYREYTEKLFGFVGGIAFLTLVVNATTSGPLLKKLGLVTPTETRDKIVKNYRDHMIAYTLVEYVKLLSEDRFSSLDFSVIKQHVPFLRDITYEQLMAAVRKHKQNTLAHEYQSPHLEHVVPYLYDSDSPQSGDNDSLAVSDRRNQLRLARRKSVANMRRTRKEKASVFNLCERADEDVVHEERLIFIQILRTAYHILIEKGEVETRGFMPYSLFKSLDIASDHAANNLPLKDWDALVAINDSYARPAEKIFHNAFKLKYIVKGKKVHFDTAYLEIQNQVLQALAFLKAHENAQKIFTEEFASSGEQPLSAAEQIVLDESAAQMVVANNFLNGLDKGDVAMIKSHYACQVLLNKSARYFEKLNNHGLVTEKEAGEFLEEVQEYIFSTSECRDFTHMDEMSSISKLNRLGSLPEYMLTDLEGLIHKKKPESLEVLNKGSAVDRGVSGSVAPTAEAGGNRFDSALLEPLL